MDSRHARGYPRRGRPESDTSSRKSARSAWRQKDRLAKEKNEKGKDRFHARGGQPPIVPSYRGHVDTQTFQAFERRVEIWMSRAESFIPPDEMGLALLDALHGAEPGTYLAGKNWRTFKVDNGVEILMNLLRPHYEADKLQIQARVLNDYSSWCRSADESIAHALLRFESLRDRVVQSGLAIPDQGQEDAQRCTSLFAKLGLSKAQVREMMTNCNLKYDYEKALHALRVLYPTENRIIEQSLARVKDLARAGGNRWGKSNSSYVTGADLDESRNLPSPGTPEHIEAGIKEVSNLILEAQKLGNTTEAYEAYSAANERLKEVTLARGFRPAEVRGTSKGGGKFGAGRGGRPPKGFGKGRSGGGKGGGRDGRRKGKGKGRGGPRPPQIRPRENESWEDLKKRTKCHVCDKTGHWKGSPDCKGAPSMSSLLCGGCNHPMSETYSRLRADYDEIMEYLTYYGEELEANTEDPNSDEKEHDIDESYEYLTYISSAPEQEQPPVHEAALAFENPLAPDGSPLPTIPEGQYEDNYDDDYLNYYATYLTESSVASESIIPSIAALENGHYVAAEGEVHDNYMTRAFELERQALEARSSFECRRTELLPLADRQGPEQADGEGLFGDHPVASAASDDQIDSTTLEQHLLLFDYLAEPVTGAADGHLHLRV